MLKRATEYIVFGAGRPFGVLWAMEKAYFDFRHRFPGKEEYAYLRLALQSRYPEKDSTQLSALVSDCYHLEDVMVKAVSIDFSPTIAEAVRTNVLTNLPPCARCGKYRALSTTDDLCYGCRKYPGFSACTHCHLYWDDSPNFCQQCGGKLWRLTDGPGLSMIPSETTTAQPLPIEGGRQSSIQTVELPGQAGEEGMQFLNLAIQAESLEERCANAWNESLAERRVYRSVRRIDPLAARKMVLATTKAEVTDEGLVGDLDTYFDALCDFYLSSSARDRADMRIVIGSYQRLAGNLEGYAGRTAARFEESRRTEFLRRGLAAASVDSGRRSREFSFVLERLWKNAVIHGFDASDAFSTVAKMSELETRDLLESFVKSQG